MDPDGFRLSLNALIQALRNVTWLLQKQKGNLPEFSKWYTEWQEHNKNINEMKWLIKARNRIVKEADLELYSKARARISFDWANEQDRTFAMPPHFRTRDIIRAIVEKTPKALSAGILTVERMWIDEHFPEKELLDLTSFIYSRTASLIKTAHGSKGVNECTLAAHKRACMVPFFTNPPCMLIRNEHRRSHIDLKTYGNIPEIVHVIKHNEKMAALAKARYGEITFKSGDAISRLPTALEMAKRILETGEELLPFAWLLRGHEIVGMKGMMFGHQGTKRLSILNLAAEISQVDADGIVLLNEAWSAGAPPEDRPEWKQLPARDRPDRQEAILVTGATRSGRLADITCLFSRDSNGLPIFEKAQFSLPGTHGMLEPIRKIWQIEAWKVERPIK